MPDVQTVHMSTADDVRDALHALDPVREVLADLPDSLALERVVGLDGVEHAMDLLEGLLDQLESTQLTVRAPLGVQPTEPPGDDTIAVYAPDGTIRDEFRRAIGLLPDGKGRERTGGLPGSWGRL